MVRRNDANVKTIGAFAGNELEEGFVKVEGPFYHQLYRFRLREQFEIGGRRQRDAGIEFCKETRVELCPGPALPARRGRN
jgi:hypothetical protein